MLFYAVAVFASFMMGLLAMARFSWQEKNYKLLGSNMIAAVAVFFTLVINLGRGYPLASFGGARDHRRRPLPGWVKAGRPEGVTEIERRASVATEGRRQVRASGRGA